MFIARARERNEKQLLFISQRAMAVKVEYRAALPRIQTSEASFRQYPGACPEELLFDQHNAL